MLSHCSFAVRGRTFAAVFKISEAGLRGIDRSSGEFQPIAHLEQTGCVVAWSVEGVDLRGPLGVAGMTAPSDPGGFSRSPDHRPLTLGRD
jgi:hypothetical protein